MRTYQRDTRRGMGRDVSPLVSPRSTHGCWLSIPDEFVSSISRLFAIKLPDQPAQEASNTPECATPESTTPSQLSEAASSPTSVSVTVCYMAMQPSASQSVGGSPKRKLDPNKGLLKQGRS